MLGGTYRGSFRPLNDAIMSGRSGDWRVGELLKQPEEMAEVSYGGVR